MYRQYTTVFYQSCGRVNLLIFKIHVAGGWYVRGSQEGQGGGGGGGRLVAIKKTKCYDSNYCLTCD